MTRINVDTDALARAASQLQPMARACEERTVALSAVVRDLDLEIRARGHFDRRLATMKTEMEQDARALEAQAQFLSGASVSYDRAEAAVVGYAPRGDSPASDIVEPVSTPTAVHEEPNAVSVSWGDVLSRVLGDTVPDKDLADALEDAFGAVPYLGDALSADEVIQRIQTGDYPGAAREFGLWATDIATEGGFSAFQAGYHVGQYIDKSLGITDTLSDYYHPQWIEDVGKQVDAIGRGFSEGVDALKELAGIE